MVSLALDPPPSAREGRSSRGPHRLAMAIFLALVAAAGFVAGRLTAPGGRYPITWSKGPGPRAASAGTSAQVPAASASARAPDQPQPAPAPVTAGQPGTVAVAGQPAPVPAASPPPPLVRTGPRRIEVTLSGPLEESIAAAVPAEDREMASELTQVVNRLLVWNLLVARDGRRGDRLEVVYSPPGTLPVGTPGAAEPLVEAVRYQSQKLSATVAAYRYQAPGARFARYFRPDGSELEERLVDAPTPEYDQVTSLLRDGRGHKGVDFRTPVGSPVFATFDGVIERRNWNFAGNGNCLDVKDAASGRHAIFLHLDVLPKDMAPGRRVQKGERIASSGNSGHSFAPHLHYQLEDADGRVLDPFEVQPVRRAALDASARPAFDAERARLDALLDGTSLARAAAPAAPGPR
ncbi:MAG TPA: M23 family metallopeptidase [Anaeromyxobacter sp.]|nr:M23 family metallopeptidase [Anaeromyxobacter sp.]